MFTDTTGHYGRTMTPTALRVNTQADNDEDGATHTVERNICHGFSARAAVSLEGYCTRSCADQCNCCATTTYAIHKHHWQELVASNFTLFRRNTQLHHLMYCWPPDVKRASDGPHLLRARAVRWSVSQGKRNCTERAMVHNRYHTS